MPCRTEQVYKHIEAKEINLSTLQVRNARLRHAKEQGRFGLTKFCLSDVMRTAMAESEFLQRPGSVRRN